MKNILKLRATLVGMTIILASCGSDPSVNPEDNTQGGLSSLVYISSSLYIEGISSSILLPEGISSSTLIPEGLSSSIVVPEGSSSSDVVPTELSSSIFLSSSIAVIEGSSSSIFIPIELSSSSAIMLSSSSSSVVAGVKVLLAGDNVNVNGPLETLVQENLSFSGGGHILVRPKNLTNEPNTKHPVAIWGPGGGTPPKDYLMLLTRMASQGFVVIGIRVSSGGSELMSAAIDWLEKENTNPQSPMNGKLILNRVGVFGHSMGGLSAEQTALKDARVTTALLDNSGAMDHAQLVNMKVPTGIIYGESGMERPNAEGDYNNANNRGPLWLGMMKGGGHGSGPWDGAGANVAWMRWHIGGESSRKSAFMVTGGAYNNTGIWVTKFKNWENWKNWNE